MYIRSREKRRKDGSLYRGFVLLESHRVGGVPKQKTLLNLGTEFAVPKSQWGDLTACVEARFKGESCLPFYQQDKQFQDAVDDLVTKLQDTGYKKERHYHWINVDEIQHTDSRTVGGERLCLRVLDEIGFADVLGDLGFPDTHVKLACAQVIGRALCPGSELHTYDWLKNESSILELLDMDLPCLSSLYRCSDRLNTHRRSILDRLLSSTDQMLDFDETVLFYDLTNTYFEGQGHEDITAYGLSKEKRNDCPLVAIAMTLNAAGFPCNVQFLKGNVSEPSTLKDTLVGLKGKRPTVVMDAGIATQENIEYLRDRGMDWICVDRRATPPKPTAKPEAQFTTAGGVQVKAWKLPREEEGELLVFIHSEAKQWKEDQILAKKRTDFEAELTGMNEKLSRPKCLKNYTKVMRKIGKLEQKHKKVSHLYQIKVTKKRGTKNAASITFTKRSSYSDRMEAVGGYVLRTSHTDWTLMEIAKKYWQLTEIESAFRVMKSDLRLRPIYHREPPRIAGHLFITILAYFLVKLIQTRLHEKNIYKSWWAVRNQLNRIQRVTSLLPRGRRHQYLIHICDQNLTPFLVEVFACLKLNYDPRETKKIEELSNDLSAPETEKP